MPTDIRDTEYTFDNGSPEAVPQLRALESFLDPITAARIGAPVLAPGGVCWEIGAGGGSVARSMAGAVGRRDFVLATDIDVAHLAPAGNLDVRRHDVRSEPPPGDAFDLIHARLVLLHPAGAAARAGLAGRRAGPGRMAGGRGVRLHGPAARADRAERRRGEALQPRDGAMLGVLQSHGADLAWAQDVHAHLASAGLVEVDTVTHSESWPGGSLGASLYATNSVQLAPELIEAGVSPGQLEAFRRLLRDPGSS